LTGGGDDPGARLAARPPPPVRPGPVADDTSRFSPCRDPARAGCRRNLASHHLKACDLSPRQSKSPSIHYKAVTGLQYLHVCQLGRTSLERHDGPLGEFFNRELYRNVQFSSSVQLSIQEQLLRSNEKQFQGGLVCKARGRLYHSTLGRE